MKKNWLVDLLVHNRVVESMPRLHKWLQGIAKKLGWKACFAAGTQLLLTEWLSKPIEDFRSYEEHGDGCDTILTRDENNPNGPLLQKRVLRKFVRTSPVLEVRIGGRCIETTSEHPFFVVGRAVQRPGEERLSGWLPAAWLRAGDLLLSHAGQLLKVEAVADTGQVTTVYNLEVENAHTYFVGSLEWGFSVWAHNSNACIGKLEAEVSTLKGQRANMQVGSREHSALTQRIQRVEEQLAATKSLPSGSTVVEVDPNGAWVRYRTGDGREMMRFRAEDAVTFQPPFRHRNFTPDREVGINPQGKADVLEGVHRAVGTANEGARISPELGGVPGVRGWLDYPYYGRTTGEGSPIRGMRNPPPPPGPTPSDPGVTPRDTPRP